MQDYWRTTWRTVAWTIGLAWLAWVGTVGADSPRLLFDRADLGTLRRRITQPEFAAIWARILADAEAYCDPQSPRYADPRNPCALPQKRDRMEQSRHDALLVHSVGRGLTQRMEAIGFAYLITGRKNLGRHGAALLAATLEQYPVTNPIIAKGFAGGRGDITRGLALGYDLVGDCLDEAQRQRVVAACADYLDLAVKEFNNPKLWWYRVHNYNGVNGGAAGCLALALSEALPDRSEPWIAQFSRTVEAWLSAGFDPDGAGLEGVSYSDYGLSNTLLFADALRRTGQGNLFAHPTFRKLPGFYALSLLPGERVYDARNDSSYAGLSGVLLKLADGCQDGLYRWLWDQSGAEDSFLRIIWENQVPALDPVTAGVPLARHFTGRGLCIWRTGWTTNDVMFSIEAGPYFPVTHNQADKGHFTLYGLGHRWATDCGYANEHEPQGRGQTLGHSCVLIDGQGQALSGAGWGSNGRIVSYTNTTRYGYAMADCTEAYNRNNAGKPGAGVEYARRLALFVHPRPGALAYAVVLDDLRKDERLHEFTWQMMFSDHLRASLANGRAVFEPLETSGQAYVDSPVAGAGAAAKTPGACRLAFEVKETADYMLWARVRTRAEEPGKADSFNVAMDEGRPVAWHMPANREWKWGRVSSGVGHTPVTYPLQAGKHTLLWQTREWGTQLDCLMLTRDPALDPAAALATGCRDALFLEPEAGQLTPPMRRIRSISPQPRLVARLHADADITLSADVFRPVDYHAPAAFPRLRGTARAINPRFIAVLLPLPAAVREPEVRFERKEGMRVTTVHWPDHTDVVTWSEKDGSVRLQ